MTITVVREGPILFSGPMVRAILDGRKTQTRRALRVQPIDLLPMNVPNEWATLMTQNPNHGQVIRCRYGQPGDHLWVRETLRRVQDCDGCMPLTVYDVDRTPVRDHYGDHEWTWKPSFLPSIHMPRWAARIVLEVTAVRVERLQDINDTDICAELGVPAKWQGLGPEPYVRNLRGSFAELWDGINGKRTPWQSNPWVWRIEFKNISDTVHKGNP